MSSPWPPSVTAETSFTETPSSHAMNAWNRAESSTPAWPITRWCGKPVMRWQSVTIASSGFEITMTNEFGAYCLMPCATLSMIFEFTPMRSSRLMPGLRGRPAVTTMTSESLMSSYLFVPFSITSARSIGVASAMSRHLPCGIPSTTSNRTTSPSSFCMQSWASTPPICPPPINAIFGLAICLSPSLGGTAWVLLQRVDDCVQRRAGAHRRSRLLRIRPVVAAEVQRLPLGADQLGVDLLRVLPELLRDLHEAGLELLVLRLRGEGLGPVEREVEVAAAVVDLADLAGRGLVVVEELADRLVERLGEHRGLRVAGDPADVLEGGAEGGE